MVRLPRLHSHCYLSVLTLACSNSVVTAFLVPPASFCLMRCLCWCPTRNDLWFFRQVMIMTQAGLVEASSFSFKKLCHGESSTFYLENNKKLFPYFHIAHLCSYWWSFRNKAFIPEALFACMEWPLCIPAHLLKGLCAKKGLQSNWAQLQVSSLTVFSRAWKAFVVASS